MRKPQDMKRAIVTFNSDWFLLILNNQHTLLDIGISSERKFWPEIYQTLPYDLYQTRLIFSFPLIGSQDTHGNE